MGGSTATSAGTDPQPAALDASCPEDAPHVAAAAQAEQQLEWDALPAPAAIAALRALAGAHMKAARLVCRAWRDALDGRAAAVAVTTWPSAGAGGAPPSSFALAAGGDPWGGGGRGPARPLHRIAPALAAADLSALPPDGDGGRLAALLADLSRLPGCAWGARERAGRAW
jgi:hypothetical protein